ncbi:MAG TPA: ABC transporter ATP-binding protein [Amaricoccus sp.]|uniref:ABC transporter ATP-binding protein n=1 Tax=Amaricoccus sp. TaxID=1872485 RepID=UPI002BC52CDA|nr:ABC transporter ATP-binding protein [Amaricoccus sp.]HMQ93711.1 ABC transporter ATP-binding protein [Amaricoccus sp.]HMR52828.1 ABC transporter ATP-binding protein [Amaricoccus sp.]HMR60234.1 ABC transporter ATP-binding protein [Amaricoccus sp.]HMT99763.1 ABC transporter ATP-binding protein [Amaricoccus sp.]
MSELRLRDVGKRYGNVVALTGIDLDVARGTRTAVVGPSGSGKTTLLRLIAGFETPDTGRILLGGRLLADPAASVPPHRRNIGLVMQDGALFPHLSVLDNIRFGMDRAAGDGGLRAAELLDLVELDRSTAYRYPHELSGGQQQRVALARALVRRPKLMLLDEPFSALDSGLREQMRKATAGILAAADITTILVTHDQAEAMGFADQIVVLRGGRLRQAGPPREVYLAPADRETARFLGEAIIVDAFITGDVAECSLGHLRVDGGSAGPGTIMLRPEQIVLRPVEADSVNGTAVLGQVLGAEYAGSSAIVTLKIVPRGGAGDATLHLRVRGPEPPTVGSLVSISILGAAHQFPEGRPDGS